MAFNYEQSIWGRGEAGKRWSDPTSIRLRRALKALGHLPKHAKVLEVGCGAGQFIRAIHRFRPDLESFGCDISQAAIALAKKSADGVDYAVSTDALPYVDGAFDAVLIFDVLEHVAHPGLLLGEVGRVLKRGGLFFAFVPCEGDWLSLWHLLRFFHRFPSVCCDEEALQTHSIHLQ